MTQRDTASIAQRMANMIVEKLPPSTLPNKVTNLGDTCSPDGEQYLSRPGVEVTFQHDNGNEYFVLVHCVADFDHYGQYGFFQIAKRGDNGIFGDYHYFFAYRGRDVGWDDWQVDVNFGTEWPGYKEFANYIEH